jgi:hypothetical protein
LILHSYLSSLTKITWSRSECTASCLQDSSPVCPLESDICHWRIGCQCELNSQIWCKVWLVLFSHLPFQ